MLDKTIQYPINSSIGAHKKGRKFIFYIDFTSDTKLLLKPKAKQVYENSWNIDEKMGRLKGVPWG